MISLLLVNKTSPITSLAELKGKRLSRINGYCTTSYFAAAIFLQPHGFSIKDFFTEIRDVGAWQRQIDAVIAGTVDLVDADTYTSLPENAAKAGCWARSINCRRRLSLRGRMCSQASSKT